MFVVAFKHTVKKYFLKKSGVVEADILVTLDLIRKQNLEVL